MPSVNGTKRRKLAKPLKFFFKPYPWGAKCIDGLANHENSEGRG
jgi:hypothetical protein